MNVPQVGTAATTNHNLTVDEPETPAVDTHVKIVTTEELTQEEWQERLWLERQVERAFYKAGKALRELRDRRLYRSSHKTFEEYCQDRFGYTRMAAAYIIAAATVMDNLSTNRYMHHNVHNVCRIRL